MKKYYFKYTLNSISVKLLSLILVTVVPIVILLIYNNNQSRAILLTQIEDTHRNMLKSYVDQMDNQLSTALSYVINMGVYANDPQIIAQSKEEAPIQYAKVRLTADMSEKLLTNNYIDGFFLLIQEQNKNTTFINSSNWQHTSTSTPTLKAYVDTCIEQGFLETKWQLCTFNDTEYLFVMASSNNNVWAGAYVRLSQLLTHFSPSTVPDSRLQILSSDGLEAFIEKLLSDTQLVSFGSSLTDAFLTETFSRNEILESLPFMQKYTILISILIVVLVVVLIALIHKIVSRPLLKLAGAMYHIQRGDLDYRIPEVPASTEIELVNHTFNQMVSEVAHLKINVYEEQLKVQKSQLRNLQMQIKPHFLINSLNMIYNLIETGHLKIAHTLIQYSIDFFRYMTRVDEDLVPLGEEIAHVKAYLEIQSIRYRDMFTYSIDVDPMISDMLVPPIMIQTFIENSIKYALSLSTILHIGIAVTSFEKEYFPYARIVITDTGEGYPKDHLDKLNSGHKIIKRGDAHIGIRNTVQRLKILFGDKASWRFYNDHGVVNEFILPATFAETDEDSTT